VGGIRRPDLDGNLIEPSVRHPTPTLLFWSQGCNHCQDLLPAARDWNADPDGARMVVATSGPAGLSRDFGLRAPNFQDDDGE
jgi:hypothetical protein